MCSHAILVLEMSKNDKETALIGVFIVFFLFCCGKAALFLIWISIMMMISHLGLRVLHILFSPYFLSISTF